MKKKLMMVAVLLGALSLGACVDNNESASVESVRNAKAKQLESVANMNNANADAKKAITAAEVAIKEAEAAYQKAQAEFHRGCTDALRGAAASQNAQARGPFLLKRRFQRRRFFGGRT